MLASGHNGRFTFNFRFTYLLIILLLPAFNAVQIKCDFKFVAWSVIGNSYTCQMRDLNVTQPKQSVTKVVGSNLSRMTNDRVKALQITTQICFFLPLKIASSFPNLEVLQVFKSKLKAITQSDLKPFTKLRVLNMHSNELRTLEANLFDYNSNLVKIDFRNQKFRVISYDIFDNLNQLSLADFQNCGCLNFNAKSGRADVDLLKKEIRINCQPIVDMIDEIKNLKTKIAIMEAESAGVETKSKYVNYESEPLMKKIDAKVLQMQTENAKCVDNLEIVAKNFLTLMSKVDQIERSLHVTDSCVVNEIANENCLLEIETLQRMARDLKAVDIECENVEWPKLQGGSGFVCNVIDLKVGQPDIEISKVYSGIQRVEASEVEELKVFNQRTIFLPLRIAEKFLNLKSLSFVNSGLVTINDKALDGLVKLKNLNLAQNIIRVIDQEALKDLTVLESLDLSQNKIVKIDDGTFQAVNNLRILRLNDNLLTKLSPETFKNLSQLKILLLKNNHLNSIPLILFEPLTQLAFADFSNNKCINTSWSQDSLKTLAAIFKQNCQ